MNNGNQHNKINRILNIKYNQKHKYYLVLAKLQKL